jgi:ATP-dependent Clp protease ATP-binding subunit ClpC
MSAIIRGDLQVIATLSLTDSQGISIIDQTLHRELVAIEVSEPTITQTIEMLRELRYHYETHHRVSTTDGALVAAAGLSECHLPGRRFPSKAVDLIDEAGSRMRIRATTTPPDLREYDEKIAQLRKEKESAIDSQDFEKALALRDNEKQLLAKKAAREMEWEAGDADVVGEVNEHVVAETLAIMLGRSVDDIMSSAPPPPFTPATDSDDDREIWSLV